MTWPAVQVKTNFDQSSDDPKVARSDLAGNVDKFNEMRSHVSSYIQGLLDDADAAAARTTLGIVIGTDVQALDATLTSLAAVAGVAGDILYASGTDTWARLAKGSDGDGLILASGIPSWGDAGATIVKKTADETVNNSTTLQNDDHLLFAMAINTSYWMEAYLLINQASLTPEIKVGITVPAGCTAFFSQSWNSDLETESGTTTLFCNAGDVSGRIRFIVRNGANAGNFQFRWAQENAHASDSKLLKHSFMAIRSLGAT